MVEVSAGDFEMNGRGTLRYSNGDVFEGDFHNGNIHG
jgi:hypothetical protein